MDEKERILEALKRLLRHFPTDTDMHKAMWTLEEVNAACDAYDYAYHVAYKAQE